MYSRCYWRLFSSLAFLLLAVAISLQNEDNEYSKDYHYDVNIGSTKNTRYLLYTVNRGEGFNLRRDVYMRIANLASLLNRDTDDHWILVLPPWGELYHWKDDRLDTRIKWSRFFDLESLERLTPVIEFEDYLARHTSDNLVDKVYHLQEFKEGWRDGKWEERIEIRPCISETGFKKYNGKWGWSFWGFGDKLSIKSFSCLSVQLEYKNMVSFLKNLTKEHRSIMLARAESLTHGSHSEWSKAWWTARRSMRFSKTLVKTANLFRQKYLNSNDKDDLTTKEDDWTMMRREQGHAVGGAYLAVHLRRRDYLYAHDDVVPSLVEAAKRISHQCKQSQLANVYLSTDAALSDIKEIKSLLKGLKVHVYNGVEKDGSRAIIDQIICSHSRHFIGTSFSTFSHRIQEERQILGFLTSSTYNSFCKTFDDKCKQPSIWAIKY